MNEADICRALTGLPLAAIARTLDAMGARDVTVVNIAESGLPDGTQLGPGLLVGEARVIIFFGVPTPTPRPMMRFRVIASYRERLVEDVLMIELLAK